MFSKILIACDGSTDSEAALIRGFSLAQLCRADVHLVGIFWAVKYASAIDVLPATDIWEREEKTLKAAVSAAARQAAELELKASTSIRNGAPVHEIAACASEFGADLVVIGHSDKGFLDRWFEGSVGSGLLRHLPCDLLVAVGNQ